AISCSITVPRSDMRRHPPASRVLPETLLSDEKEPALGKRSGSTATKRSPMKLDAKTVAALRLDGKTDAIFFDSEMPGFGHRLRLGKDGKVNRSWIVQYRRAGSSRRLTLRGVLSAAQAREAAKKALAKRALGEDPQAERQERRAKEKAKFATIEAQSLDIVGRKLRPRTLYENRRYLSLGYFKPLHDMPLDKITRKDVAAQLVRIEREHGSAAAHAARAKLSGFFVWALKS